MSILDISTLFHYLKYSWWHPIKITSMRRFKQILQRIVKQIRKKYCHKLTMSHIKFYILSGAMVYHGHQNLRIPICEFYKPGNMIPQILSVLKSVDVLKKLSFVLQ